MMELRTKPHVSGTTLLLLHSPRRLFVPVPSGLLEILHLLLLLIIISLARAAGEIVHVRKITRSRSRRDGPKGGVVRYSGSTTWRLLLLLLPPLQQ